MMQAGYLVTGIVSGLGIVANLPFGVAGQFWRGLIEIIVRENVNITFAI